MGMMNRQTTHSALGCELFIDISGINGREHYYVLSLSIENVSFRFKV